MKLGIIFVVAAAFGIVLPLSLSGSATTQPAAKALQPIEGEAAHLLRNAHIVTPRVISGAQPEGDVAFKALQELGVKTIVSVDGAKPDIETAARYGMRYIHLPIGYDDVPEEQGMAIAKAISEIPGTFYIHCHHGKHRSAAAVAVACVYGGQIHPDQAESVLQSFGTGENYKGLWRAARNARPIDPQILKDLEVEYVETAKIPPIAEAMVSVDRHWDHLKLIQKSNWQVPPDHPDLDPAHEALQLQEHLHEIGRTDAAKNMPDDFRQMLLKSENAANSLRDALQQQPINFESVESSAKTIATSCTTCHKAYRD